jgi:hypothetical protein
VAIEIIVETGANVPNANSYVSVDDARTYAANRGVVLPADDDAVAAMLIQASDYLEAKSCEYQGVPTYTDPAQSLAWPRTGAIIGCTEFPSDQIPKQLIAAQVQLAMAVNAGIALFPNVTPQDYVTEETVGPITTKYADPSKIGVGDMSPQLTAVDALLANLFASCDSGFTLRTIRV